MWLTFPHEKCGHIVSCEQQTKDIRNGSEWDFFLIAKTCLLVIVDRTGCRMAIPKFPESHVYVHVPKTIVLPKFGWKSLT
jgi:hypothetical protein